MECRGLLIVLLVVVLVGCAEAIKVPGSAAVYDPLPSDYQDMVRESMEMELFDSDSAKFKFGAPVRGYANKGILRGGGVTWTGYMVSASINAKNRFGAYVGWKPYTFYFDDGAIYRRYEGGVHPLVTQQGGGAEYSAVPGKVVDKKEDEAVVFGKYQYAAEKLAGAHGCDSVELLTQAAPVEVFQAACAGAVYVVRCEWNQCAVVR